MPNGNVDYAEIRRKIHEAIVDVVGDEENEDTILSGWALIWEGIHSSNRRSLSYLTSDATGDAALTPWAARGYMKHIEELFFIIDEDIGEDSGEEDYEED